MPREYSAEEMQSIALLQDALYTNPETRRDYLRLVKKIAPKAPIPEIDVADAQVASLKPTLDRVDKLEARVEQSERTRQIEDEWRKHRVTPEERTEVEKLMTERLIGDVGTAVDYYRGKQAQPAARPGTGPTAMSMPTGDGFKGLFQNPDKWSRDEAHKAIGELQQQRA